MIESFKKNKQSVSIRKLVCESLFEGMDEFSNPCFKSKEELDDLISSQVVYPQGFDWIFVSDINEVDTTEKASIGLEHRKDLSYISLAYEIDLKSPNGIKFGLLYEVDDEVTFDQYENLSDFIRKYNSSEELRTLVGELPTYDQREALENTVQLVTKTVNEKLAEVAKDEENQNKNSEEENLNKEETK